MRRTKELLPWDSSRYLGLGQEQRKGHNGRGRGGVVVLDHSRAAGARLKWGDWKEGWIRGGTGRKIEEKDEQSKVRHPCSHLQGSSLRAWSQQ